MVRLPARAGGTRRASLGPLGSLDAGELSAFLELSRELQSADVHRLSGVVGDALADLAGFGLSFVLLVEETAERSAEDRPTTLVGVAPEESTGIHQRGHRFLGFKAADVRIDPTGDDRLRSALLKGRVWTLEPPDMRDLLAKVTGRDRKSLAALFGKMDLGWGVVQPLRARVGAHPVGLLLVVGGASRPNQRVLRKLAVLANLAATAFEHARLVGQLEQAVTTAGARGDRLEVLNRLAVRLAGVNGRADALGIVGEELETLGYLVAYFSESPGKGIAPCVLFQADPRVLGALAATTGFRPTDLAIAPGGSPVLDAIRKEGQLHRIRDVDVLFTELLAGRPEQRHAGRIVRQLGIQGGVAASLWTGKEEHGMLLLLEKEEARRTGDSTHAMLSATANLLRTVLARVHSGTEWQKQTRYLEVLRELTNAVQSRKSLGDAARAATSLIRSRFEFFDVSLFVKRGDHALLLARTGGYARLIPEGFRQHLSVGMIGWCATSGRTLVANDVRSEPHFVQVGGQRIQSELCLPLLLGNEVVGVLDVENEKLDQFTASDVQALEVLAGFLALHVADLRRQDRDRHLAVLPTLTEELRWARTTSRTFQEVALHLAHALAGLHGYPEVRIYLAADNGRMAAQIAAAGTLAEQRPPGPPIPVASSPGLTEAARGHALVIDVLDGTVHDGSAAGTRVRSIASVPILARAGAIGAIEVGSTQLAAFSEEDLGTLQTMAAALAAAAPALLLVLPQPLVVEEPAPEPARAISGPVEVRTVK